MLSKGQLSVLQSGRGVDGSIPSSNHIRNVHRTVKVKVSEAADSLRFLYEKVPEHREMVRERLRWFLEAERGEAGEKSSSLPKKLPDSLDHLEEYHPDPSSAFKGFKS